ncbi:MAG: hypothetical protein ACRD0K_20655 [Egibacteraceae bacterium]
MRGDDESLDALGQEHQSEGALAPPSREEWLRAGRRIDACTPPDAHPDGAKASGWATVVTPSPDVVAAYCDGWRDLWKSAIKPSPVERFQSVLNSINPGQAWGDQSRVVSVAALAYSATPRAHESLFLGLPSVWRRVEAVYARIAAAQRSESMIDLRLQAVYAVLLGWGTGPPLGYAGWSRATDNLSASAFRDLRFLWRHHKVLQRGAPLDLGTSGDGVGQQIYGQARAVIVAWSQGRCVKDCACEGAGHIRDWKPKRHNLWDFITNQFFNTFPEKITQTPAYPLLRDLQFDVKAVAWPICPHPDSVRERIARGTVTSLGARPSTGAFMYRAHDYLPRDIGMSGCATCRAGHTYALASRKLLIFRPEWQGFHKPDHLPPGLENPTVQMMRDHNPGADWFFMCQKSSVGSCHRLFVSTAKDLLPSRCGVPLLKDGGTVQECDGRPSSKATWEILWRADEPSAMSLSGPNADQLETRPLSTLTVLPGNVYRKLALTAYRDSLVRPDVRAAEPLERHLMMDFVDNLRRLPSCVDPLVPFATLLLQAGNQAADSLVGCWIVLDLHAEQSPSATFVERLGAALNQPWAGERLRAALSEDHWCQARLEAICNKTDASMDVVIEKAKAGEDDALPLLARILSTQIRRYYERVENVALFVVSWVYPRYPRLERESVPHEVRALCRAIADPPPWKGFQNCDEIPRVLDEVHGFAAERKSERAFCPVKREFIILGLAHGPCPCHIWERR